MRKLLIVTYYWPPAGGPGVQRWLYFVKYLRTFGMEPVLYIPEKPHYPMADPGLEAQVPEGLKVFRSRFWEPYALARLFGRKQTTRISSGIIRRHNPGLLERLMLWVRGNLFIPDARKNWVKKAAKELPGILEQEGIDLMVTTGPPHSLHLIGLEMAGRRPGLRWVADFRDPWTEIGYHSALYLGPRAKRKHRELESRVLGGADAILTTSRFTAGSLASRTARPVHVITNGFDRDPATGTQPEGPFVLAHIGSLLSGRNPNALWEALAEMVADTPGFRENLRLELTGLVSPEVTDSLRHCGLEPFTVRTPYVPHQEALHRQRKSQVLLLLEIDSPETRGIVPGKLFEYMAAARPVLAIGPSGWEAAERVAESQCGAGFHYGQKAEILAQLRQWYDLYCRGDLQVRPEGVSQYHRRALTERLVKDILWELSSDNPL
ncbi:glycosyltransferase [Robiginitalea sp. SC105]|uniref:glycosyltransferase n=1 Tax=Robiginitalea sp. SC105 TaxID=2762332 RepID=UPI00163A7189|nr:glycosyltransferase [Robiginitalea sp. SC105]MBC2840671.1 glycosyltransferase [Robiginitalea sp. SC105]